MIAEGPEHTPAFSEKRGLAHWMRRVLIECRKVEASFDADAVHDLRVALRRCRSMAAAFSELDADAAWPAMRRASRKLFRRLGELRDTQVSLGWVEKLAPAADPTAGTLTTKLRARETLAVERARNALEHFDRAKWKSWAKHLSQRAEQVPLEGDVFQLLALERWQAARALHRSALRNRSRVGWHNLRIGLKRLRYVVENFLPARHAQWGKDLKQIQDLLGEVHDLDILGEELRRLGSPFAGESREQWEQTLARARETRLAAYRQRMAGKKALWQQWRAGLVPAGRLREAAFAYFEAWAGYRDDTFAHARHVTLLALNLFDELSKVRTAGSGLSGKTRDWLRAAALLHNVGRSEGRRGHHKTSYRMISEMTPPPGWTAQEMEIVAQIARYHRGAEPALDHSAFAALDAEAQRAVTLLSGILRLAAALDADHSSHIRRLRVESQPEMLFIFARGYREEAERSRILASERHLLERALKKSVMIRTHPGGPRQMILPILQSSAVA